jgi:hypothetical protein
MDILGLYSEEGVDKIWTVSIIDSWLHTNFRLVSLISGTSDHTAEQIQEKL